MAKDPIKKADNGTYYFRANLGYNPITGKQIQKYRSGFKTKKGSKGRIFKTCPHFHRRTDRQKGNNFFPDVH